ncbi:MAG: AIPR family protein [Bacteroidales bacterium]
MDRIVKNLVEDFLKTMELSSDGQEKDFEKFANYCLISKEYNKSFDVDSTCTGSGDDTGIDGIAIIVNGQLIENTEDIEFLLTSNNYLEGTYIFIQSKTSNDFSSQELNNFGFGVKDFFSECPKLRRNREIEDFAALSNYLLSLASKFRTNPKCKLYYSSNGTWNNDQNNNAILETVKTELGTMNLFSEIFYDPIDANEISRLYRNTKNSVTTTFVFQDKVTLPDLPNIIESYLGILPLLEFRKILIDENENIRNIFYDNVRDFQGINNPVNSSISETLNSEERELFTVLNNGVTIVANDLKTSGNRFTISDYQIVNGCQTSNMIYEYLNNAETIQNFQLPIKLIVTNNDEIKNQITVATNSQTAIKREQLQAMTDFQKNLELYFQTFEGEGRLHYERRSGQFQTDGNIIKARIINIKDLIKSFSSIFYENPDRVTTYFGSIVAQNIESESPMIFNSKHSKILYYAAAFAYYRMDTLFNKRMLDSNYRKVKFFLLMLFRMLIKKDQLNIGYMSSDKISTEYCSSIIGTLHNIDQSQKIFLKAIEIIKLSGQNVNDKQLVKQVAFTKSLKEAFIKYNEINK